MLLGPACWDAGEVRDDGSRGGRRYAALAPALASDLLDAPPLLTDGMFIVCVAAELPLDSRKWDEANGDFSGVDPVVAATVMTLGMPREGTGRPQGR